MTAGRLHAAYPQLFVADIVRACAYYEQVLGFRTVFQYGEPPFYGQVARDHARLNLRCVDAPVIDAARRARDHLLSAYIPVTHVAALFAELQHAGARVHEALVRKPWGTEEFVACDLDGNLIAFGEA